MYSRTMITLEYKLKGKETQYRTIDEMIRTFHFVRNKCLRFWIDAQKVKLSEVNAEATRVRHNPEFPWAGQLESSSAQAASERAMSAIRRLYDNCKVAIPNKKGYPKFHKRNRSVEYKVAGWKLSADRRRLLLPTNHGCVAKTGQW